MRRRMGISYMSVLLFFCFLLVSTVHFISRKHWNYLIQDLANQNRQKMYTIHKQGEAIRAMKKELGIEDPKKYNQFANEKFYSRRWEGRKKEASLQEEVLNSLSKELRTAYDRYELCLIKMSDGKYRLVKMGDAGFDYLPIDESIIPKDLDVVTLIRTREHRAAYLSLTSLQQQELHRFRARILWAEPRKYYFVSEKEEGEK